MCLFFLCLFFCCFYFWLFSCVQCLLLLHCFVLFVIVLFMLFLLLFYCLSCFLTRTRNNSPDPLVQGVLDPGHLSLDLSSSLLSLIRSLRGPLRRQILLGSKGGRSWVDVRRGSWGAHNPSASSMDRDFGALGDLLEALLVASRCPRDLHSLQLRCPELFRADSCPILSSPQLNLSSENEIFSSPSNPQST